VCTLHFYGTGGEWTLQDDITTTAAVRASKGTLNTNNKAISCNDFNSNLNYDRTVNLGASVITCTGNFEINNIAGLTLNAGTSTIILTGDSKTFAGGNLTYHNLELQGTPTIVTGSNTFNELKIASGKTANLTAGTAQTVTSLAIDGATLQSTTTGTPATISKASGAVEVAGATIKDITATGGATFNAINSINVSGNTGWNWITSLRQKAMSMGMSMGMGL